MSTSGQDNSVRLPPSPQDYDAATLQAAADQLGAPRLADWAVRLLTGTARAGEPGDPDIALVGGVQGWMPYWSRVWGARALLHQWPAARASPAAAVREGLTDEHWRVRVLCAQIVAVHRLKGTEDTLLTLVQDAEPTVRTAAIRALGEVGTERSAPTLSQLVMDPDSVLADAAEQSLDRMAERLERPALRPSPEY